MFLEFSFSDLSIVENFCEQATADVFASVNRDDGGPPIRMLEVVMTAATASNNKTQPLQGCNEFTTRDARQPAHRATLTR